MAPTGTTPLPQVEHSFHSKDLRQTALLLQVAVVAMMILVVVVVLVDIEALLVYRLLLHLTM
jgi:hypothetical protein